MVGEIVGDEGEADDFFAFDGDDAAGAAAAFFGEFEGRLDRSFGQLALGGFEEFRDLHRVAEGDDARIERRGRVQRPGDWDAEADAVAVDVEAFPGQRDDFAEFVGRYPQRKGAAARRERDRAPVEGDAADQLDPEPVLLVQLGPRLADRRIKQIPMVGGKPLALHGKRDSDCGAGTVLHFFHFECSVIAEGRFACSLPIQKPH